MKNLTLTLLLILPLSLAAQSDVYASFEFDPNKAFSIIDNPRTEMDHNGLDFDFEIGARGNKIGMYIFYGRFENANYQNYGVGLDYYLAKGYRYDIGVGANIHNIMRHQTIGNASNMAWATYLGWSVRSRYTYWILPKIGVSGVIQYTRRPDINVGGIVEGRVGVVVKVGR